jgi:beta-glucosidase
LNLSGDETITATFTVTNTGQHEGADVPQVYLTDAAGDKRMRLLAFDRLVLKPGETKRVTITADPRLLARFDDSAGRWRIAAGRYQIAVARSANDPVLKGDAQLDMRIFGS